MPTPNFPKPYRVLPRVHTVNFERAVPFLKEREGLPNDERYDQVPFDIVLEINGDRISVPALFSMYEDQDGETAIAFAYTAVDQIPDFQLEAILLQGKDLIDDSLKLNLLALRHFPRLINA